jgi:hypothetical protein
MVRTILFTTTSCPKCPAAKEWVANHPDLNIETCVADVSASNMKLADTYNVMYVPTFVQIDDDGTFKSYNLEQMTKLL